MNTYVCTWNNETKTLDQLYDMVFKWIVSYCSTLNQAEVETYTFIEDCIRHGELKRADG